MVVYNYRSVGTLQVLEVLPPSQWTMVHGQCLGVGVAGFTLGGGVNMVGTTARYGAAMEQVLSCTVLACTVLYWPGQVLSYRLVTAGGDTVQVGEEGVTFIEGRGDEDRSRSDIFFGLRGAGASFGVVTEFLGGEMTRVRSGCWYGVCCAPQ